MCRKFLGGSFKLPKFAPFPAERTEEATPFSHTGLDYFGPVYVKSDNQPAKAWVCLFTCLKIRAVHLEYVPDMTTSEFLGAFHHFISHQGCPTWIFSDNATQFKAANAVFQHIWRDYQSDAYVSAYCLENGIKWKFIISLSPWQGGVYERMVGTVKSSLKKALGRRLLYPVQLQTLLCKVEAVVNSHPLIYLPEEFPDHPILSPAHFLHPQKASRIPDLGHDGDDPDYSVPSEAGPDKFLHSLKKQQEILNHFWQVWKEEYLPALQERQDFAHPNKKSQVSRLPELGEVVLLKEDGIPHGHWKLAKVVELIHSRGGGCSAVKVQLPNKKIFSQNLNLVFPLEVPNPEKHNPTVQADPPLDQSNPSPSTTWPSSTRAAAQNYRKVLQRLINDGSLFIAMQSHTLAPGVSQI